LTIFPFQWGCASLWTRKAMLSFFEMRSFVGRNIPSQEGAVDRFRLAARWPSLLNCGSSGTSGSRMDRSIMAAAIMFGIAPMVRSWLGDDLSHRARCGLIVLGRLFPPVRCSPESWLLSCWVARQARCSAAAPRWVAR
jgi:hypothetical protein